jgi:hypothetical protein
MGTVGQVITQRSAQAVVGRERELTLLAEMLGADGPLVVYVHGLGGMGKTALLAAFGELARSEGAPVATIDCRAVEPTERGLLDELAGALGSEATLEGVVERAATLGTMVLVLDTYERFRLLDSWIRRRLIPSLPDTVRVVVASRESPAPGWETTPAPAGPLRSLELGPLPEADAVALLCKDNALDEPTARRLNRSLRGHPLALQVARAAAVERRGLDVEATAVPRAVEALTRLYLDDLDPLTRRVVDAASTIRRTTISLLDALLGDRAPPDGFDRLRGLPFVELAADGLHLHDSVQEMTAETLRATDPSRYRTHRRAAWRQLRREFAGAPREDLWRYTADLLYLIEQPIVREAFFPTSGVQVSVEPAREEDGAAIREILERHDRPGRADVLLAWWERLPQSFSVARDRSGQVVGFDTAFEYRDARRSWLEDDPLTSRWLTHLRQDRVAKDQLVLFNPRWLDRDAGDRPADTQAAFFMEAKRVYMELRPHVRRLYLALTDISPYAVILPRLGFRSLPDPQVVVDGITYHSFVLDLGPGSVDGWLSWLIGSELGVDDDEPQLDPTELGVRLGGRQIKLSPLEFGILQALIAREGRAASRAELIEEVWGTSYLGGSNVVDAVVRTLRRKLGDDAALVGTVRGVGYRCTSGIAARHR